MQNENTARVVAIALLLWAVAVGTATAEGVFEQLAAREFAALAVFATFYAPATYRLDRRIRELVLGRALRSIAAIAIAFDALLIGAYLAGAPWPLFAFFGLPVAIVAHVALAERSLVAWRAVRSGAAKSPDGRRAAT
jgi:hypothetical protein